MGKLIYLGSTRMTESPLDVTSAGVMTLPPIAGPTLSAGALAYDSDNESLSFRNNQSAITLQIGQENWVRVYNNTGATILNGSAVYISGMASALPSIALAQANAAATVLVAGLATHDIPTASIGYITAFGSVRGINTSAFAAGGVYLSSTVAGGLTQTLPSAPNYRFRVGSVSVVNATTGVINVQLGTGVLNVDYAAKGDMVAAAGAATPTILTVGSNNQVLTADSTQTLGVKWATPPGGDSYSVLTYAATTTIDFSSTDNIRQVTLTGNVTFATSNKTAAKSRVIKIVCDSTARTLTFPSGWVWMGGSAPVSIGATRTAVLSLLCLGTAETDVIASYSLDQAQSGRVFLAADVTNSNATLNTIADVTGLSFPVAAGVLYKFTFNIFYTAAAATTGSRWAISGPASPTFLSYDSSYTLTAATETINRAQLAYDLPAASNASSIVAGNNAIITGKIKASTAGNVIARFASEIASSAIVAKAVYSFVEYEAIG